MNKVKITYEYCGLKAVPKKWFNGFVIEYDYQPTWYEGSEIVDESIAKKRINELSSIVFNGGGKKYRSIKIG